MTQTMTMTITRSGQITLPKAFREMIGVKPGERVTLEADRSRIQVRRQPSEEEFRKTLKISPETRAIIERDKAEGRKLSASQMLDEYYDSPAGQAELEREYGTRLA